MKFPLRSPRQHPANRRFRAVMMTAVFSGMLVATLIGIVFIPALFVLFQRLREWGHRLTDSWPRVRNVFAPARSANRHC
jgi:Cu/Ag efflux pump CusA